MKDLKILKFTDRKQISRCLGLKTEDAWSLQRDDKDILKTDCSYSSSFGDIFKSLNLHCTWRKHTL